MSPAVRRSSDLPEEAPSPRRWPQDVSHEPLMKIGEVVERLKPSFPALSLSKVRYLESEGLESFEARLAARRQIQIGRAHV